MMEKWQLVNPERTLRGKLLGKRKTISAPFLLLFMIDMFTLKSVYSTDFTGHYRDLWFLNFIGLINHINSHLPSVLFWRQYTPINFIHRIGHNDNLKTTLKKCAKIVLVKTFHKICHSISRRCKLYCYQKFIIRYRYSSNIQSQRISYQSYNLSLKKDSNTAPVLVMFYS